MISMSEEIYSAICDGMGTYKENVSTEYPNDEEVLPWAVYACEKNTPAVMTSAGESKSEVRYRVELIGKGDIEPISFSIANEVRNQTGLKRCDYQEMNTPAYKKTIMRFEGSVDVTTGAVYRV